MLEPHPDLVTPGPSTSIWRYMAIDKFLHLLTSSSLWFSRCDYFEDGWEGHYSKATYDTFLKSFVGPREKIQALWDWHQTGNHAIRKCLYINCWHMNKEESAALWQIHSTFGKSVAVKSTMRRLRAAITDTDMSILIGRVQYSDYSNKPMKMGNLLTPFVHKRRSFAFEREVRLLHWNSRLMSFDKDEPDTSFPHGTIVPVKLKPLIEAVYVSPKADSYLLDAITALLRQFELPNIQIVKSDLLSGPT